MEESNTHAYALDYIFISIVIGICCGIIFDVYFRFRFDVVVIMTIAIGCFGVAMLRPQKFLKKFLRAEQFLFCISIICFTMLLGMMRMQFARGEVSQLENSVGQKVTLTGIIDVVVPKTYNQQTKLSTSDGQTILVYAQKYPHLTYGDDISITGILQKPKNFTTNQGTEFDYVSYLYKDDIAYVIPNGQATIISHGKNYFLGPLYALKNWFIAGYAKVLPPDEADLMGGLTLGTKENISPEFRDSLVETSTIHIIALSGYNVTIVANFLRGLLAQIPLLGARGALVGGGIGIIFFVLMTGAQSSAIRAGIMALVALFGRGSGREYDAFRALVLAGFIMILWNPKFLVYDVSFQLSFLATLGMIYLTPKFLELFRNIPEFIFGKIPLRELMSTTLGAQTSVVPFIIYKMGVFSLVALPANILILPAVPFAMGIGTLAGIIGNFSIVCATPFAFVTHLLLRYIIILINFFAKIPFAYLEIPGTSIFICLALYILIMFWVYTKKT